ncbi:glycosyltransferase [Patescibacteria group bacterium]|nr:glycosyltransferase [Patescibacteria group bacterium]MBU1673252.1 glycosyltransferase [Patescibacteria group bacterium]MBU1963513.1 glycosyltransferase [Patescibacteria group bacterium]
MDENIKISIIIPVVGEKLLPACLESIKKLDYPKENLEIIVVNNLPENTKIKEVSDKFNVKYTEEKKRGSYRARNMGGFKARGKILAFTDVDCEVNREWLKQAEKSLENSDIVIGWNEGINANKTAALEQAFYEKIFTDFTKKEKLDRIDTRNCAMKKDVFKKLDGFQDKLAFGGDMEFGARAADAGLKITFNNDMKVKHRNPAKLMPLIAKRITQNFDNYNITEFHDDEFLKKYFPHIYDYKLLEQKKFLINLKRMYYQMILGLNYFLAPVLILILPGTLAYIYYKKLNGLCMHFGFLANISRRK